MQHVTQTMLPLIKDRETEGLSQILTSLGQVPLRCCKRSVRMMVDPDSEDRWESKRDKGGEC
jgi:hypothetical protein